MGQTIWDLLLLSVGGADTMMLTATTTASPQNVTLHSMAPVGGSITVAWGDGTTTTIAAGDTANQVHSYATADTYQIRISPARRIQQVDLRDTKLSCVAGQIGRLTTLTALTLYGVANVIVGASEIGNLTAMTSLALITVANVTVTAGEIGRLTNLTLLNLNNVANVTVGAGEINKLTKLTTLYLPKVPNVLPAPADFQALTLIRTIQYENGLNQATVDAILQNIWLAKATYTWATPNLDLLGEGNAAPSGVYASVCPPTSGQEWKYDLVNGICTPAGPEWTVATA